jgi:hypothetical protein
MISRIFREAGPEAWQDEYFSTAARDQNNSIPQGESSISSKELQ